jgi:hypothetical protein
MLVTHQKKSLQEISKKGKKVNTIQVPVAISSVVDPNPKVLTGSESEEKKFGYGFGCRYCYKIYKKKFRKI